ncbi:MAG: serine hydrolase [Bacteroidales bacterium]|nr:serine hydrolase [Bacteroidales bacterium]MCF8404275.1 serine hydrolase [Bacteroidales bacterium]
MEEKIAQLMMVRTYSNKDGNYYRQMDKLVEDYNVGGFCFFQGGPVAQAKLTNRYQKLAKTPLFIAMDAEWGLGMRLDSSFSFPFQMTIGATSDDEVVYQMGKEIARQLKLLGVHINFAPVIDVNNNPSNPVINSRSFGEYPEMVANHGIAYMKGLQDNGIIATAKHFPGHGDTDSDSHLTLPLINHSIQRLDSVELLPFKRLISQGLGAVMVAHLFIPAMDSTPDLPSTLSENIVNGWLKNKLGFEGLVISDALDMKGVTKYFKPGEIEIKAFKAGIDILLLPQDVSVAIKRIKEAVVQGEIQEEEITQRCKKILRAKEREKLNSLRPVDCDSVYIKIHNVANQVIERKLYKQAITVVKNNENILPLQRLDTLSIAVLSIGSAEISPFQRMLNNYSAIDFFNILDGFTENQENQLLQELSKQNLLIIGLHNTSIFPNRNFGISNKSLELIKKLSEKTRVILAMFSSPYSLGLIEGFDEIDAVILGYQDSRISQEVCAQIIMGAIGSRGILPVSAGTFRNLETTSLERLKYGIPEDLGIDSRLFDQIDSIALKAIADKAMPGCQILIAKDGNVIYQKSFGYHTYKKGRFVKNTDLYDLASITKIAASTLSIMNLVDEGKFDIDQKLKLYLPYLKGSNKEDLITRDLLSHQARLQAWIPFYLYTLKDSKPDPMIFRSKLSPEFTTKVAENLFIRTDYSYILYDTILNSELRKKKEYKYSDLGFYLLKQSIENITNKPLSSFVEDKFYNRLGLQFMGFNPIDKFNPSVIVPTENDQYFRFQLIHGYVHDPGAAMLGGVSGHAGLFSNANDLAILMQMLLQEGYYGGIQYLNSSTIKQFTKQQFPLNDNRRALGFDKPNMEDWEKGPTCKSASESSFGHSGFTGTYVWTDPEFGLTYIFLSNRIHPSAENTKLIKWNTRTEIQKIIYNAIGSFVK